MPEVASQAPRDQADGLRRLFGPRAPRLLPILLACKRRATHGVWLARFARCCVSQGDRTVLIDAARTQVATQFGLKLRFDLQHALFGDCTPQAATAQASEQLLIVPAARAYEQIGSTRHSAERFVQAVRALGRPADCALLLLPAPARHVLASLAGPQGYSDVLIVVDAGAASLSRCLDTMKTALGAVDIDLFRVLFLDMDAASAGRLFARLAAVAERELGASLIDGGRVADSAAIGRVVRSVLCRLAPDRARAASG
jgi:hypothetical protein